MSSHLLYPRSPKSIEMFLADYNINRETDIDYFLIHQANKMIVDRIVVFVIRLLLPLLNMRILVMVLCVRLFIR